MHLLITVTSKKKKPYLVKIFVDNKSKINHLCTELWHEIFFILMKSLESASEKLITNFCFILHQFFLSTVCSSVGGLVQFSACFMMVCTFLYILLGQNLEFNWSIPWGLKNSCSWYWTWTTCSLQWRLEYHLKVLTDVICIRKDSRIRLSCKLTLVRHSVTGWWNNSFFGDILWFVLISH